MTGSRRAACAVALAAIVAATGSSAAKRITLRFMYWGGNAQIQESINDWNKLNPDIQVKYEAVDWGSYFEKLPVLMASGKPPDTFICLAPQYLDLAQRGVLQNLSPYYKSAGINLNDMYPAVKAQAMVDGSIYGTSSGGYTSNGFLGYNMGLFDKVGLKYPDAEWDLNDLVQASKKFAQDTDGDGIPEIYGTSGTYNFWPDPIYSAGGSLFDKSGKRLALDENPAMRAMTWMSDLFTKYNVSPPGEDGLGAFSSGKLAMMAGHTPGIVLAASNARNKVKVGATYFPMDPVTKDRRFLVNVAFFCMAKGTKYPKEAWRFLKYISYDREDVKPPAYGMPQAVPIMRFQAKHYLTQPKASWSQLDPAIFLNGLDRYTIPLPKVKRYDKVLEKLSAMWPRVRQGKITVSQFVSLVTQDANTILARK